MARHLTLALFGLLGVACDRTTLSDVEPIVPSTIQDARTFTVSGIVFESMPDGSRRPVPDVGILRDVTYARGGGSGDSGWTTDSEGRYAIGDLPAGSQVSVVAFTGPWYQPCAATATMTADVSIDIEIARRVPPDRTLHSPPILSGIVSQIGTDGRRQPLAARDVSFMAQCRGLVLARTYTDADGRYELCRLPTGPGCVTVTCLSGISTTPNIARKSRSMDARASTSTSRSRLKDMDDLPIVCTLTPGEMQTRKASLLPGILARADGIEPLAQGYRVRFAASSETLQAIAAMIDAERQCCRFLRFELTIERDEGPLVLDVTGPQGTRDFLAAIIDPSA